MDDGCVPQDPHHHWGGGRLVRPLMRCPPPRGLHSAAEGGAWGDPRDSESVTLESERREEEDAPRAAPKHEGARGRGGG